MMKVNLYEYVIQGIFIIGYFFDLEIVQIIEPNLKREFRAISLVKS